VPVSLRANATHEHRIFVFLLSCFHCIQ
jgi:hypothetical protein